MHTHAPDGRARRPSTLECAARCLAGCRSRVGWEGASRCRTRSPGAVSSSTHLSNSALPREVPSFSATSFGGCCREMPCHTPGGRSLCPIWGAWHPSVRVQTTRQFRIARAPSEGRPGPGPPRLIRLAPPLPPLSQAPRAADSRREVRCWCATLTAIRYAAVPCHRAMSSCDRIARSWGRACWSSAINAASALHASWQLPDPSPAPTALRSKIPRHRVLHPWPQPPLVRAL